MCRTVDELESRLPGRRTIEANFAGGAICPDGYLMLLWEACRPPGLVEGGGTQTSGQTLAPSQAIA
ncbi:MAG: hypothetical protein LBF93_06410 [Zoogloeaceae bacterium]|nr:hypothetical protein [Zoogloeaceae bacterium]